MNCFQIRAPRESDLPGIVNVIQNCGPYLTAYSSYQPWLYLHLFSDTCAVAEINGTVVGWCSVLPAPDGRFFLHQLGVRPEARQQGIARSLLRHALEKLSAGREGFTLELTTDRRNTTMLEINRQVAEEVGMQITRKPEALNLLENSEEEIYVFTRKHAPSKFRSEMDKTGAAMRRTVRSCGAFIVFLLSEAWTGIDPRGLLARRVFQWVRK
jgi:L-2,4-diaminobutyric acid acetyltransferase